MNTIVLLWAAVMTPVVAAFVFWEENKRLRTENRALRDELEDSKRYYEARMALIDFTAEVRVLDAREAANKQDKINRNLKRELERRTK